MIHDVASSIIEVRVRNGSTNPFKTMPPDQFHFVWGTAPNAMLRDTPKAESYQKIYPSYSPVTLDVRAHPGRAGMASPFVPFHVASDAKCLPAPGMRTLERLFAGMRVAVDL